METEAFYAWFARYYDLLHTDLREDLPYWECQARAASGPVLELGCGSGRILVPLARAGTQVTGLDNAPAMLALARQRLDGEPESVRAQATLVQADMTAFRLGERFRLVFVGHNTFSHLTPEAMGRCLHAVRQHLAPGGKLLLDLPNPLLLAAIDLDELAAEDAVHLDPQTGEIVRQSAASRLDPEGRRLCVTWEFRVRPATGGAERLHVATLDYHLVYPHELELMLAHAGMRLAAIAGGYAGEPFQEESDRLLVTAQARN